MRILVTLAIVRALVPLDRFDNEPSGVPALRKDVDSIHMIGPVVCV